MTLRAMRFVLVPAAVLAAMPVAARAQTPAPATPAEMVATYDALADTILGANKAEKKLVHSILAATYGHAQANLAMARQALKSGDTGAARAAIENLATAVGQIGTEGDNAVGGVRKRLLEGGHHHNAEGEEKGIYEPGYVIVTKTAKQKALAASQAMQTAADDAGRKAAWDDFEKVAKELLKD